MRSDELERQARPLLNKSAWVRLAMLAEPLLVRIDQVTDRGIMVTGEIPASGESWMPVDTIVWIQEKR